MKKEEETVVESLKIEENNVEKISTIVEEEIPADPVQMEIAGSSEVISPGSEILRLEEQQTDVSHQQLSEPEIPFVRKSEPISVAQLNVEASSSPTVCAKLYPEFGELQTEETTVTIRSPISRMRKSSVMILPPYTEAQLRSFYSNAELELCERFTDDFVQVRPILMTT